MDHPTIKTYEEYAAKIGDRRPLYRAVATKYDIKTAAYPGSFIDLAPSLVIPKVIYIDNFKGAISFFKNIDIIKEYIQKNKDYSAPCEIEFIGKDYNTPLDLNDVDLIISQYAGFVGQATKQFLKPGGILLCNDSHGDATLARFDPCFEFIGIVDSKYKIKSTGLEDYFKLPKGKPVDLEIVKKKMKGPKYTQSAENYLFRRARLRKGPVEPFVEGIVLF